MDKVGRQLLTNEEKERVWVLLLHLEKILNDRTNFFVVAESVFISTYMTTKSSFLLFGGISLSFLWLNLQHQTFKNSGLLLEQIKEFFPEFEKWKNKQAHPFRSNGIITYGIPGIFLAIWLWLYFLSFIFLNSESWHINSIVSSPL
jgi:hypothetical protein